jgi:hypothetical protein
MLQNRVDPSGNLIKTKSRGAWMGNRGVLHDGNKNILRPFKHKAWIICLLEFKNWKREVMAPDRYTELFFLDEATACAAGHRPCFECRREDANRFKTCWLKGNPEYGFSPDISITEIDKIIHGERIGKQGDKVTYEDTVENGSDGIFILVNNEPYVYVKGGIFKWSPSGYGERTLLPETDKITILTPRSIVNAFKAGYEPQIAIPLKA